MSLIDRLVTAQARVDALLAQPDPGRGDTRAALRQLRPRGAAVVCALTEAAARARRDQLDLISAALHDMYTPALARHYLEALGDRRAEVAMCAARALEGHVLPEPAALLKLFADFDAVKPAVLVALKGQRQWLPLNELLRAAAQNSGSERDTLFDLMATAAGAADVPALAARLDARDSGYRHGVVRLLGGIGGGEARAALMRALTDGDPKVRLAAIDALAAAAPALDPPVLVRALTDDSIAVQNRAIELLVASDRAEVPQLLAELLGHGSERVRRAAVEVLSKVATAGNMRALLGGVRDRDWWVRSRSADALGKIGGARVIEAAGALLDDDDAFIRRAAVEILNATGTPASFEPLAAALKDPDWWVRERAIDGVVASGDPRAAAALQTMLRTESDEQARIALIGALMRLRAPGLAGELSRLLPEATRGVQVAILNALDHLPEASGDPTALSAIATLIEAPDDDIRQLATRILGRSDVGVAAGSSGPRRSTESAARRDAGAKPLAPAASLEGQVLGGRYRVLRQLGRGAFGTVLLAEDTSVGETIALKFLHPHLAGEPSFAERFVKELKLARRIMHPGVIRIHDLVHLEDSLAISMEYLPSEPLSQILRAGPLDAARACDIGGQVARAVSAAHAASVIHRDLKPGNILIGETGFAKVVDFGIAAAVSEEATRLTKTGAAVGTPRYMSPEQIKGARVDERTDVYSLGAVIYEMLTGRTPFVGANAMAIMYQHLHGLKEPPSRHAEGLPPALDELVMRCLATEPADRVPSMDALAEALAAVRAEL